MARQRKNYVLFKAEGERGLALAGSYSSRKRAEEAIKADATTHLSKAQGQVSIEYTRDGAILWQGKRRTSTYELVVLEEDTPIRKIVEVMFEGMKTPA